MKINKYDKTGTFTRLEHLQDRNIYKIKYQNRSNKQNIIYTNTQIHSWLRTYTSIIPEHGILGAKVFFRNHVIIGT